MADAYRKVLGDVCVGGFAPQKVQVPCPPTSPFSRGAVLVLILVLLMIGVLAVLTYAGDNERVRKFLERFGVSVESVRAVRYSTLGKGWGGLDVVGDEPDEFDHDAPQLVTVNKQVTGGSDLLGLDPGVLGGVRMRAGGIAAAVEAVPRLLMPTKKPEVGKELDEML